jgi:hypothetical protein
MLSTHFWFGIMLPFELDRPPRLANELVTSRLEDALPLQTGCVACAPALIG